MLLLHGQWRNNSKNINFIEQRRVLVEEEIKNEFLICIIDSLIQIKNYHNHFLYL